MFVHKTELQVFAVLSRYSDAFNKAAEFFFSCSPLYRHLARCIAADEDMLHLVSGVQNAEQSTYLLFASVLYALHGQPQHPLAAFYPILTANAEPPGGETYPLFVDFVRGHLPEIAESLRSKPLNRSVIRRSACLAPLVSVCARIAAAPQVNLIDIGCGAGFNLLLDENSYEYLPADGRTAAANSRTLSTELRGALTPRVALPRFGRRIGIDLELPDLGTEDDKLWILSQLIPEDVQSYSVASTVLRSNALADLDLRKGDASEEVERLLLEVDNDDPIIIMHSVFIHYLGPAERAAFLGGIANASRKRTIMRAAMEIAGHGTSLAIFSEAGSHMQYGRAEIDGTWIQWMRE